MNNRWMNGQHLRALPSEELTNLIGEQWRTAGILTVSSGPFIDVRSYFYAFFSSFSVNGIIFFFLVVYYQYQFCIMFNPMTVEKRQVILIV